MLNRFKRQHLAIQQQAPWVIGNGGAVLADGPPGRTYPHTARLRIPAIGALALTRWE
jgi:hypothetical protein